MWSKVSVCKVWATILHKSDFSNKELCDLSSQSTISAFSKIWHFLTFKVKSFQMKQENVLPGTLSALCWTFKLMGSRLALTDTAYGFLTCCSLAHQIPLGITNAKPVHPHFMLCKRIYLIENQKLHPAFISTMCS